MLAQRVQRPARRQPRWRAFSCSRRRTGWVGLNARTPSRANLGAVADRRERGAEANAGSIGRRKRSSYSSCVRRCGDRCTRSGVRCRLDRQGRVPLTVCSRPIDRCLQRSGRDRDEPSSERRPARPTRQARIRGPTVVKRSGLELDYRADPRRADVPVLVVRTEVHAAEPRIGRSSTPLPRRWRLERIGSLRESSAFRRRRWSAP
jgi:hypothetical protein